MAVSIAARKWTLEELHGLPDDGNTYELIHGELFVTPAPGPQHEAISARLRRLLERYVEAQGLGGVFTPRGVVRFEGSEVEPDLTVRSMWPSNLTDWAKAPIPILVVEVLSPYTRRRDREQKRSFYLEAGVAEYWIVDPERRELTAIRPDRPDIVTATHMTWQPSAAGESLRFEVSEIFD